MKECLLDLLSAEVVRLLQVCKAVVGCEMTDPMSQFDSGILYD